MENLPSLAILDNLPPIIRWVLSCALTAIIGFIAAEWWLLGQPGNNSFEKQIDRIRARAEGASVAERYQALLGSLLAGIDRFFGPVSDAVPGSRVDRWFGCQPWTAISYERLLNLAFVYPAVLLIWGGSLRVEDIVVWTIFVLPLGVVVGYAAGLRVRQRLELVERIWLRSLLITFTLVAAVAAVIGAFTSLGRVAGAAAGAGGVMVSIFVIVTVVFAVAVAGPVAGVVAIAMTIEIAVFVAVSVEVGTVTYAAAAAAAATVAAGSIFFLNVIRYKLAHQLVRFWIGGTVLIITISIALLLSPIGNSFDGVVTGAVLILVFIPLFNAPLDWLSLGVTRGLIRNIASGRHNSLSAFGWALIDIALALLFLIAVGVSSFFAWWLVNMISPDSVSSLEELREIVAGGHDMSIGIWLMLASTLLPTFLHFLVALLAFVSLPFSRDRASETADALQEARDEMLRRDEINHNRPAQVDAYARRWAMMFFGISWPVVFVLWLLLVSFLSYVIYKVMQWMFVNILSAPAEAEVLGTIVNALVPV